MKIQKSPCRINIPLYESNDTDISISCKIPFGRKVMNYKQRGSFLKSDSKLSKNKVKVAMKKQKERKMVGSNIRIPMRNRSIIF